MDKTKVNTMHLKTAIEKFGTLRQAVEELRTQQKTLEASVASLNAQVNVASQEKQKLSHENKLLLESKEKERTAIIELTEKRKRSDREYHLFESFVAMLLTSPSSESENLKSLAEMFDYLSQSGWAVAGSVFTLRQSFVQQVMGNYLHSYRCGGCGVKFIASTRTPFLSNCCPLCLTNRISPDDSFLVAMINPDKPEQVAREQALQAEVERLKYIPCQDCGKLLLNPLTVDQIVDMIQKALKHNDCKPPQAQKQACQPV